LSSLGLVPAELNVEGSFWHCSSIKQQTAVEGGKFGWDTTTGGGSVCNNVQTTQRKRRLDSISFDWLVLAYDIIGLKLDVTTVMQSAIFLIPKVEECGHALSTKENYCIVILDISREPLIATIKKTWGFSGVYQIKL